MSIDEKYQPIRPVTVEELRAVASPNVWDDRGHQVIRCGFKYEVAGSVLTVAYIDDEQARNALTLLEDHWHTNPSIVTKDKDLIATWFTACGDVIRVVFRESHTFLLATFGGTLVDEPITPNRPTKFEFLMDAMSHRAKTRGDA